MDKNKFYHIIDQQEDLSDKEKREWYFSLISEEEQ